jgi:hypothetical protein
MKKAAKTSNLHVSACLPNIFARYTNPIIIPALTAEAGKAIRIMYKDKNTKTKDKAWFFQKPNNRNMENKTEAIKTKWEPDMAIA